MKIIKTFQPIEISVSDYNINHCGSWCKHLDTKVNPNIAYCNLYNQFLYNKNTDEATDFLKLNRCDECKSNIGSKISQICDNCGSYNGDCCNCNDSLWYNSIKPSGAECWYFYIREDIYERTN